MRFSEVLDHPALQAQWTRSWHQGRIAHAQMLLENEGHGGLAMALAFATLLNCQNPKEADACGQCRSCQKMARLIHPDVHFSFPVIPKKTGEKPLCDEYLPQWREALLANPYLGYLDWMQQLDAENKQGNISAHECRNIIRKLSLKAFEGGWKILILWLPDFLGKEGNMLLKLIEEPPPQTLFLLIAHDEAKVLATILSRTQVYRLGRPSEEAIAGKLSHEETLSYPKALPIAQVVDGNYNLARKMALGGQHDFLNDFIEWMRMVYTAQPADWLEWCDGMNKQGREAQKYFLQYALRIYRETLLSLNGAPDKLSKLPGEQGDWIRQKFARKWQNQNLYRAVEALNEAHFRISRNVNSRIVLFDLSLQLHNLMVLKKV